ncbi:MAG: DUF1724 domain-containing protein [Euryarchaeota archaeon]|nr:DUF1724 domain-containing protein [Euryarchaeota archaeon]MBU4547718.1 DUF1724 domain-containing protein [Euryarchaeota archaeon]MBV1754579.1 DUF1724 domain-containing protein [Methanobacterium sp.]MBV1768048.1 DUF1724 domain-containing protein [Methanobacterium sp.]
METNQFNSLIEEMHDEINFLVSSHVKIKIMLSLRENPKKLGKIREETSISSSTIIHSINQLDKRKFVTKISDTYSLTSKGKLISSKIVMMLKNCAVVKKHENFFASHSIEDFPKTLSVKIGQLNNSILIESTKSNISKPFTTYSELLKDAEDISVVLPVFFSRHMDFIKEVLDNGGNVSLILRYDILESLLEHINIEKTTELIKKGKLNIRTINDEIPVAFLVNDHVLTLGLFFHDGSYDVSKLLLSHDKEAINWGKELFEYYKEKSEKIDIKNL